MIIRENDIQLMNIIKYRYLVLPVPNRKVKNKVILSTTNPILKKCMRGAKENRKLSQVVSGITLHFQDAEGCVTHDGEQGRLA